MHRLEVCVKSELTHSPGAIRFGGSDAVRFDEYADSGDSADDAVLLSYASNRTGGSEALLE